jgi:hypothetical protein
MMPQEENRSEPLETVEDARERVAAYRLGIPQVEDLEKRFQERLSPEQRSAYRELQIRQVVHAQMREEAVLAVLEVLIARDGNQVWEFAEELLTSIVDDGETEFLRQRSPGSYGESLEDDA